MNKRGAELSMNVVIIGILLLILLVIILAFFSGGFGKIKENIERYFGGSNLDSIITTCSLQCTTNQINEFCNVQKKVRGASQLGITDGDHTCKELKGLLSGKNPNLDDCALNC